MQETDLFDPTIEPTIAPPPSGWRGYHAVTRTATYGFLMALPLIVVYEALILFVNQGQLHGVRIGAEVWMKQALASLGLGGLHLLTGVLILVGLAIFFYERRKHIPIRPRYFGWVIAESAVYAVVLAIFVSSVVGAIFAMIAPQMAQPGLVAQLALSIGAGIYEELLFRVILVGGLYAVLRRVLARRLAAYLIAAVVGALIFSAVHYIGALGDAFTATSFTFRFLFGLALNAVFLARGFGVAAWTHALYDVMLTLHLLG